MALETAEKRQKWLEALRIIFSNEPYSVDTAIAAFSHIENLNGRASYNKKNNRIAISIPENPKIKSKMTALLREINNQNNGIAAIFDESSQSWELYLEKDLLQQDKNLMRSIMVSLCQKDDEATLVEETYAKATKLIEAERKNVSVGLAVAGAACTIGIVIALAVTGTFIPVLVLAALAVATGGTAWAVAKRDADGKLASSINRYSNKLLGGIKSLSPFSANKTAASMSNSSDKLNMAEPHKTHKALKQDSENVDAGHMNEPRDPSAASEYGNPNEDPALKPFMNREARDPDQLSNVISQESVISMDASQKTTRGNKEKKQ